MKAIKLSSRQLSLKRNMSTKVHTSTQAAVHPKLRGRTGPFL